jgi:nitronate monooxygenase
MSVTPTRVTEARQLINQIKEKLTIPVVVAPMFLISNPEMVISACTSGVMGSFPAWNARTAEDLDAWMEQITTELAAYNAANPAQPAAPWALNVVTHRSNKRYAEDLEMIAKWKPDLVITALGGPQEAADIVHQYGGLVFADVINVKYAKKALAKGADGLILVAAGAGGHGGSYNPFAFVHEVREFFDGPLILSGSLSYGEDVLAAELIGADLAYMGTRFLATHESWAFEPHKEMVIDAKIDDILYTDAISGVLGNYLIPSIVQAGLDPENLEKREMNFDKDAKKSGPQAWKDIWGAGHAVSSITQVQSVAEVVAELAQQYDAARSKLGRK